MLAVDPVSQIEFKLLLQSFDMCAGVLQALLGRTPASVMLVSSQFK